MQDEISHRGRQCGHFICYRELDSCGAQIVTSHFLLAFWRIPLPCVMNVGFGLRTTSQLLGSKTHTWSGFNITFFYEILQISFLKMSFHTDRYYRITEYQSRRM